MPKLITLDAASIYDLKYSSDIKNISWPRIEAIMSTAWINHEYPYGYILVDDGMCVGNLFTIYANKLVNGCSITMCDLSNWYVDENYRASSMMLLMAAKKDAKDCVITALSASGLAAKIYQALKFSVLDSERWAIKIKSGTPSKIILDNDINKILFYIEGKNKKILNDHRHLKNIEFYLINAGSDDHCFFVTQSRVRGDMKVSDLLYFSGNLGLLNADWTAEAGTLIGSSDYLLIDDRFTDDKLQRTKMNPYVPRQYLGPANLRPYIDFMYTEIPLFNVSLI